MFCVQLFNLFKNGGEFKTKICWFSSGRYRIISEHLQTSLLWKYLFQWPWNRKLGKKIKKIFNRCVAIVTRRDFLKRFHEGRLSAFDIFFSSEVKNNFAPFKISFGCIKFHFERCLTFAFFYYLNDDLLKTRFLFEGLWEGILEF